MIAPPPDYEPFGGQRWIDHVKAMWRGDAGDTWTPTYTSLTESGTATHTGFYKRLSQTLYQVRVRIVPGTNTSSVAGTTYLNNFPLTGSAFGHLIAINETTILPIGTAVFASNGRIYTPTWTTVTAPITISGIIEAR